MTRSRPVPAPARAAALLAAAALVLPLLVPDAAGAQAPRWSWPERAENLKVLPGDTPPERLRDVMRGFTAALGVRCDHCHEGEAGAPLADYDFASDAPPAKATAREMMRMLGEVRAHLDRIEPSGPAAVAMDCATCHRGRPRPTTLVEELREAWPDGGADAALARYAALRDRWFGRGTLDFGEGALAGFGRERLAAGDAAGAATILEAEADAFPESARAWHLLAEARDAAGDRAGALAAIERALALAPDDRRVAATAERLGAGGG